MMQDLGAFGSAFGQLLSGPWGFFTDHANPIFTIGILLFLAFELRHVAVVIVEGRSLKKAEERLKSLRANDPDSTGPNHVPSSEEIGLRPKLGPVWNQFQQDWNRYETSDPSKYTLASFRHYPDPLTQLELAPRLRTMDAVPGALLSLGILGTFIGLVSGMGGINVDTSDPTGILDSVKMLIGGLSTAFYTSVLGISMSFGYLVTSKFLVRRLSNNSESFVSTVERLFPGTSEAEYWNRSLNAQEEQTAILKTMTRDLVTSMNSAFSSTVQEHLGPMFQEVRDAIKHVASSSAQAQLDGIDKITSQFVESMNSALGNQFESLGSTLGELKDEFDQISRQLTESAKAHLEMTEQAALVADVLTEQIPELTQFSSTMKEVGLSLRDSVSQIEELKTGLIEGVNANTEAGRKIVADLREMSSALDSSVSNLKEASQSIGSNQEKINKIFEDALNRFDNHVRSGLIDILESFDSKLGEVLRRFSGTLSTANDSLGNLDRYSQSVLEAQEKLGGELSKNLTELKTGMTLMSKSWLEAVDAIAEIPENISTSSDKLTAQFDRLPEQLNSAGKTIVEPILERESQAGEVLEQTRVNLQAFSTKLSDLSGEFAGAVTQSRESQESIVTLSSTLDRNLQAFNEGVGDLVSSHEKATQELIEQLQVAIEKAVSDTKNEGRRFGGLFNRGK